MKLKIGQQVLIEKLSLQYSDYKNLDGVVLEIIDGDYVRVAIPKDKIFVEDERELSKDGDNVLVRVKKSIVT